MNTQNHPSKQTLVDFASGKLEAESIDQVAQHIENCPTCVEFLEHSVHDTMIDQLRLASHHEDEPGHAGSDSVSFDVGQTQHFQSGSSPTSMEELFLDHPKYKLISQIGSGGMGAVYQAQHRLMDRDVAIKIIRPELISNSEAVARFQNEVRAAARLSHRNIVAAYDAEQVGESHILVMEFVVGESLAQTVARKGKLPVTHACNYALQIAQGLKHAHQQGMIHRDIKPQNLMKTPKGIIKILDFGLARVSELQEDNSNLTSTGVMMGTADYISPEQARSARDADIRSDLYSLGCTFYYLLAGETPFRDSKTRVDKILAHCSQPFPSIISFREDVPPKVESIIRKLTQKDPAERYQSPQDLIDDLLPFAKPKTSSDDGNQSLTVATENPDKKPFPLAAMPAAHLVSAPKIQPNANPDATRKENSVSAETSPSPSNLVTSKILRKKALIWGIGTGLGIAGLVLVMNLMGFFGEIGGEKANSGNSNKGQANNNQNVSESTQTVAAVFVYDQFCYGDFGPMRDLLKNNGIQVITASTAKGTARYIDFADDTTPNKQNVAVEYSLDELATLITEGRVDAIVFIGGAQLLDGIDNRLHANGQAILQIVRKALSQKGWIGAIGKGVNVPYALGILDGAKIVDVGQWLETEERQQVETTTTRVHADLQNRVITATEWRDSTLLAEEISKRISN